MILLHKAATSKLFFPKVLPEKDAEDPSLQEMLNIQTNGLRFGAVGFGNVPYEKEGQFLVYKWDVEKLDNKHIFIVGQSSSGKTLFLKNLASEIRLNDKKKQKKTRIIMTDLQGDISQILFPDLIKPIAATGWQSRINRPTAKEAEDALKPYRLIIPASREPDSEEITILAQLAEERGVDVQRIGLRFQDLEHPSDVEYLYRVNSEQVAMLLDEEAETIRGSGRPVNIANLRESVQGLLSGGGRGNQVQGSGGTTYYTSTAQASI